MTLRRQMMLLIAAPALLIYAVFVGVAASNLHRSATKDAEASMRRIASSYAAAFDARLVEASRIAETTASFLAVAEDASDEAIYAQLEANVRQTPLVYGAAAAFEPGARRPGDELFSPYVCRDGGSLRRMNIDRAVYDWFADPSITWYSEARRLGHGVWSDPYLDEGAGDILMCTYSAPYRRGPCFGGVCTVDIDLPRLRETVGRATDATTEFSVLTREGRFVYDRDPSRIMTQTVTEFAADNGLPDIAALAPAMLSGEAGSAVVGGWDVDEPTWVFYAPIPSADWVFVSRVPERIVLADVRRRTIWVAGALAATLALMLGSVVVMSGTITRPIERLREKVGAVGKGELGVQLDATGAATEIQALATTFNRMTKELQSHIERLATEIGARSRIERDLDVAREIQQGLLPSSTPDVEGYDIAGISRSADKTGGDYYDWVSLPDGRLFVSLADVSGHGIGPALVTAVCRAYVHASLSTGQSLTGLFGRLNDLLASDLPDNRFVTFVAVTVDPVRHTARLLSAGHAPLFRYIAAERRLEQYDADALPLGVAPGFEFPQPTEYALGPGDFLLLPTDGLFECTTPSGEPFGIARLREAIEHHAELGAEELIARLVAITTERRGGAPQEDDVTAVVIRRRASGGSEVAQARAGSIS